MAESEQRKIIKAWQSFSQTLAYHDLISYINDTREMYRKYAEERAMPHPDPEQSEKGAIIPIDNEMVAALLQNSRGLNNIKTYIEGRVNTPDVAQPKSNK